jgi:predicted lipoprotein with Yx(FWY)xxD motif
MAACGGGGGGGAQASPEASPAHGAGAALVHVSSLNLNGQTTEVLKNPKGLTLYYFKGDSATQANCTGPCTNIWPPLLSPAGAGPTSASPLQGKLTVLNGANGAQVLYAGHPLYTYSKDGDAGDAYGQGFAGKWYVATPDLQAAS